MGPAGPAGTASWIQQLLGTHPSSTVGNGTLNKLAGIDFKQLSLSHKLNENQSGEVGPSHAQVGAVPVQTPVPWPSRAHCSGVPWPGAGRELLPSSRGSLLIVDPWSHGLQSPIQGPGDAGDCSPFTVPMSLLLLQLWKGRWQGNDIIIKMLKIRDWTTRKSRDFNEEYPKLRWVLHMPAFDQGHSGTFSGPTAALRVWGRKEPPSSVGPGMLGVVAKGWEALEDGKGQTRGCRQPLPVLRAVTSLAGSFPTPMCFQCWVPARPLQLPTPLSSATGCLTVPCTTSCTKEPVSAGGRRVWGQQGLSSHSPGWA